MPGLKSLVFFKLIYDYLQDKIEKFGLDLMTRSMQMATTVALVLVTLWIIIRGYQVITGNGRESLLSIIVSGGRMAAIVGIASTMSFAGTDLYEFFTSTLDQAIHGLFSGRPNVSSVDAIDDNLTYTQLALSTIDTVHVPANDPDLQADKIRAHFYAMVGTASPPMVAAAMLLLYQVTIALFIGLGPLFIMCLLFPRTQDMFTRWLNYGLGTLFSMGLFSAMVGIVLELSLRITGAFWGGRILSGFLGGYSEGLSTLALQQGGIGLLLTVLIISVPPMGAMFFQGTMGHFMQFSAFSGGGGDALQGRGGRPWQTPPSQAASAPHAAQARETRTVSPGSEPAFQRVVGTPAAPAQADRIRRAPDPAARATTPRADSPA